MKRFLEQTKLLLEVVLLATFLLLALHILRKDGRAKALSLLTNAVT